MQKHLIICLLASILMQCFWANAEEPIRLEGEVSQQEHRILQSGITHDTYANMDVQVNSVSFYYNPDAEVFFQLLKEEGQKQYPHLLGYREIDGLYKKALSESAFEQELTEWKYQGGPKPYYIKAGAKIRNNGSGAMTDVKLTFVFEGKVAPLRVNTKSITTDYKDLERNSKWQPWLTKVVNIDVLPPGEYKLIQTEDISLAAYLEKLSNRWPETIRVKVFASSPMDGKKENNFASKSIKMIPDHFVMKVLR